MGKAKVKKPKPATAGEKIAWDCKGNDSLVYLRTGRGVVVTEAREVSRRIDRAIARAVQKERERCGFVVFAAKCNCESFDWAHQWILHPEKQKP